MQVTTHCGVPNHDHDCLCDVVVTDPVPIRYGVTWHADVIARAKGLGVCETLDQQLDLLEAIMEGYEATCHMRGVEGFPNLERRDELIEILRDGRSILDAPTLMGLEWHEVMQLLTKNIASRVWTWDEQQWIDAETLMHAKPRPTLHDASVALGLHRETTKTLWDWYGAPAFGRVSNKQRRVNKLAKLVERYQHEPVGAIVERCRKAGLDDTNPKKVYYWLGKIRSTSDTLSDRVTS